MTAKKCGVIIQRENRTYAVTHGVQFIPGVTPLDLVVTTEINLVIDIYWCPVTYHTFAIFITNHKAIQDVVVTCQPFPQTICFLHDFKQQYFTVAIV